MLDNRQYRSENPCLGDAEVVRCKAALDSEYTMLGAEQEAWVAQGFSAAAAKWNIVAQQSCSPSSNTIRSRKTATGTTPGTVTRWRGGGS